MGRGGKDLLSQSSWFVSGHDFSCAAAAAKNRTVIPTGQRERRNLRLLFHRTQIASPCQGTSLRGLYRGKSAATASGKHRGLCTLRKDSQIRAVCIRTRVYSCRKRNQINLGFSPCADVCAPIEFFAAVSPLGRALFSLGFRRPHRLCCVLRAQSTPESWHAASTVAVR